MLLRSYWPKHQAAELDLQFQEQFVIISSKTLFLNMHMPYPFDSTKGKAKFVKEECVLEITLPVIPPIWEQQ